MEYKRAPGVILGWFICWSLLCVRCEGFAVQHKQVQKQMHSRIQMSSFRRNNNHSCIYLRQIKNVKQCVQIISVDGQKKYMMNRVQYMPMQSCVHIHSHAQSSQVEVKGRGYRSIIHFMCRAYVVQVTQTAAFVLL